MIRSITPSSSENMAKVSVLIPSRNEKYLTKTVDGIFAKATGNIEVIIVLEGPTSYRLPHKRKNLILIQKPQAEGLRKAINDAAKKATGKYLLKTDAHCAFNRGFDEILKKDCEDNWVVIPRRFGMDPKTPALWKRQLFFQADYYLTCPWTNNAGLNTTLWNERAEKRRAISIDETMSTHGSVWFMPKDYYFDGLQGLDTENFGYWGENEEIAVKAWLGGGRVMVNKNTWYAHLQMRTSNKAQRQKDRQAVESHKLMANYWTKNLWRKRIHDFDWLIDKFWPLPTQNNHYYKDKYFWPENWRDYYEIYKNATELCELALTYGSDKCPQIKHHYTPVYFDLFGKRRKTVKKVLEIGVGDLAHMPDSPNYKVGGNLYMWRDFFPNAQIYGADILPELVFEVGRIKTLKCDQSKKEDLEKLIEQTGRDIDLFIDDASRRPEGQVFTCLTLMPLLKKEVTYVIEDVIDLGIMEKLNRYDCQYTRFRNKSSWDDRLIVVRNK